MVAIHAYSARAIAINSVLLRAVIPADDSLSRGGGAISIKKTGWCEQAHYCPDMLRGRGLGRRVCDIIVCVTLCL